MPEEFKHPTILADDLQLSELILREIPQKIADLPQSRVTPLFHPRNTCLKSSAEKRDIRCFYLLSDSSYVVRDGIIL